MRKHLVTLVTLVLLALWYSIIFWDPAGFTVGDSPEVISIYTLLMVFLIISIAGKLMQWKYSDHFSALYLTAWAILQWQAHWQAFFFGASSAKIDGYNSYFSDTYRFAQASEQQVIPDMYHTILGVLLAITLLITLFNVFKIMRRNFLGIEEKSSPR
ncbi:MAG: hypothetical protein K9J27_05155 [Bacteroidales bacterium]|nr:hypothetical protein [Bacteroidales bacterium]MCF8333100.1 hypothetical protein [Bacteroidales bacterium]